MIHPEIRSRADSRSTGHFSSRSPSARLDEAVGLARAIELVIVEARVVPVTRIRPATLIGKGAVDDLALLFDKDHQDVELAVVDAHLSPVQQRNLEKAWNCKVIDRTGLILEIFGQRARTREGVLQVELAALVYARSRLVRSWTHLERQRGGLGFVGGPGETQIEADRRMIGERITRLRRELDEVKRTRDLHRRARKRVPYPVVALVGYTNAGKSTLFNRLTRATVLAEDQLFATLDPTMRALALPSGRRVILSDTVGFISDLPHELVAAFRATLEEVREADLIIHVRDVSHEDSQIQRDDVLKVLAEMEVDPDKADNLVEVLNKLDLVPEDERQVVLDWAAAGKGRVVAVSALTGEGTDALLSIIDGYLDAGRRTVEVEVPVSDGATLGWLYRQGEVLERHDGDETIALKVRLEPADAARLERLLASGR